MDIKKVIFQKLKKLTKKKFDENSNIYDIGIDSLDLVELVTDAEDEFGIVITDEALESIKTIGDIIKVFKKAAK